MINRYDYEIVCENRLPWNWCHPNSSDGTVTCHKLWGVSNSRSDWTRMYHYQWIIKIDIHSLTHTYPHINHNYFDKEVKREQG